MMEKDSKTFILFPSHMHGISLEKKLKESDIEYAISPTPRELSTCCGISIMIDESDIGLVEEILENSPQIKTLGIHTITKKKKRLFDF